MTGLFIKSPAESFAVEVATTEFARYQADANNAELLDSGSKVAEEEVNIAVQSAYTESLLEFSVPFECCRVPAVILTKYNTMTVEEQVEYESKVLEAIIAKEKVRLIAKLAVKKESPEDYSKGFGGTEADSKNEKDAAALLRGTAGAIEEEEADPYLRRPRISRPEQHRWLKQAGHWKKFPGADCVMYIHCLSRDIVSIRPAEYEDEPEAAAASDSGDAERVHPAHGLPFCTLSELPAESDRIIAETNKTPLVLDTSPEHNAATFFAYKARLEVTSLH